MAGFLRQGPYRFLLTQRWAGLLAVAVVVATGCVAMGAWQVDRLSQRHARNDLLERTLDTRPVAVADVLRVGRGPAAADQFTRIRATGGYDVDDQLLVRTRLLEGQVGFHVLTPLVTDAGPALLVNRGWVPRGATPTAVPKVPAPPRGRVTVVGRVRPSEPASTTGEPPPGQVTRIDVPAIAGTLPYDVFGGYVELVAERPSPGTAPRLLPAPEPTEGPHLAYAFQWFLFAGLALGGYVVLARREAADREAARREPAPARVAGV
ncbi:MAG: SURF1 family cytochrome oxidase biogenesis protein [Actinomycetes bacterium]